MLQEHPTVCRWLITPKAREVKINRKIEVLSVIYLTDMENLFLNILDPVAIPTDDPREAVLFLFKSILEKRRGILTKTLKIPGFGKLKNHSVFHVSFYYREELIPLEMFKLLNGSVINVRIRLAKHQIFDCSSSPYSSSWILDDIIFLKSSLRSPDQAKIAILRNGSIDTHLSPEYDKIFIPRCHTIKYIVFSHRETITIFELGDLSIRILPGINRFGGFISPVHIIVNKNYLFDLVTFDRVFLNEKQLSDIKYIENVPENKIKTCLKFDSNGKIVQHCIFTEVL